MITPIHYTPDQAAEMLGVTKRWLEDHARRRQIPHTRLGRRLLFTTAQIERISAQNAVPTVAEIGAAIARSKLMR